MLFSNEYIINGLNNLNVSSDDARYKNPPQKEEKMNHPNKCMMYCPIEPTEIAVVEAQIEDHCGQERKKLKAERRGLEDAFGTRKRCYYGDTYS